MSVAFPTEFPALELKQVIKFVTKQDSDLGKMALAAYNIIGYAGYQAFGSPVLQLVNGTPPGIVAVVTAPGVVIKPEVTLSNPTPEQITECVQGLNDLLNTNQLKGATPGEMKGAIPSWVLDLLYRFLQSFLKTV